MKLIEYSNYQIKVADEDVTFTFTGKGKVSVEYRGRFL